jgi:hypothetical protein
MLDDDTLKDLYSSRGVPTDWQEITPEAMAPAFKLWFRALPSPKSEFVDGSAYAEWLIHDPIAALRDSGLIPRAEDDAEAPHVSTMVVNHEKTLNRFIMYAVVLVPTNPKTIGITIVKEEAPGD